MKPVVVVGTGIVGASIAYHLARAGAPVTVVGRDAGVTAASFAWIGGDENGDWPGGAADLAGLVRPDWQRVSAEVPGLGVRWTGSLRWPVTPAGASAGTAGQVLVGAGQVAALEPSLRACPDRARYAAGDGGVDPARAARAFLLAARDLGARVVPGVTVSAVNTAGVSSTAGFHPASTVVLAAGAGTAALARRTADPRIGGTSPALLVRVRSERPGLVRGIVCAPGLEVREVRGRDLLLTAPLGTGITWAGLRERAGGALRELRAAFGDDNRLRLAGWQVGVRPMPYGGPVVSRLTPYAYGAVMHSGVCLAPSVGRLLAAEIISGVPAPELARCR